MPTEEPDDEELDASVAAVGSLDAALLAAVSTGASTWKVRALLARGASPNAAFIDNSALIHAVRSCEPGVTQALLDAGAELDKKDPRGWTALMHAIDAHSPAEDLSREGVMLQLLDAGASVDVWGNDLRGPLDLMVAKQQQQATAMANRASHIAASKITMLMHQKSSSSGSTHRMAEPFERRSAERGSALAPSARSSLGTDSYFSLDTSESVS